MGEMLNPHKILVGKPEGEIQFWRSIRRWEDNTNRYLKKTVYDGVERINMAQAAINFGLHKI
jgi:hypothetical protein